jgi:integrase
MFNTRLIERYQTDRLQEGRKTIKIKVDNGCIEKHIPNKPATINRHIATIKHMFTKAVEWDMVEEETLKRIRKSKLLEENNRRLRYLYKEECQALVNACSNHLTPIVITALNTGMRRGEILSLKWENVDLNHGFILQDKTKNGKRREMPINDTLRATLTGIQRRLDVPYVFYDPSTAPPYGDIKNSFKGACKRAGIRDFHFHDLRRTFTSHLVIAGIDIATVRELL